MERREGDLIHFNNPSREEREFEIQIELGLGLARHCQWTASIIGAGRHWSLLGVSLTVTASHWSALVWSVW